MKGTMIIKEILASIRGSRLSQGIGGITGERRPFLSGLFDTTAE